MLPNKDIPISFPGLFGDWQFNLHRVAIPFDENYERGIYWYGILICVGLLIAVVYCAKQAKKYGLTEDHVYDLILWELPFCIIGARLYYVLFYLDLYRNSDGSLNLSKIIAIWDGGLAIYGGIIVAFLVLYIFCRVKKIAFGAFADLGVMGLLIGQSVGRWGNFMNREAFGSETTLPWRMGLMFSETRYVEVHPTFLYESLWNFIGLLLIIFVVSKARTFDGENTCFYLLWYGIGRTWIEGLRTDSLYLFDWALFGKPIRISQALSIVLIIAAFAILIIMKRRHPHGKDALFVTKLKLQQDTAAEESPTDENTGNSNAEVPAAAEDTDNSPEVPDGDTTGTDTPEEN